MVESIKVLDEALDAGAGIETVFVASGALGEPVAQRARTLGHPVFELAPGVLERVAGTAAPQPVLAVLPFVDAPLSRLQGADLVVVAVDVRDPGNAGTVLRSAEGAGVGGVVLCEGTVDLYNPKTVRASAGAMFHLPVVLGGPAAEVISTLSNSGLRCLATSSATGVDYAEADLTTPTAFVFGNEANGLDAELGDLVDGWLTIPMTGRTESLNVGVAAAILCFEAARQRRRATIIPGAR